MHKHTQKIKPTRRVAVAVAILVIIIFFSILVTIFSYQPDEKTLEQLPERVPAKPFWEEELPVDITATVTHPAAIIGRDGFEPEEISIEAGDSITWTNADIKLVVLTFQNLHNRYRMFTSSAIKRGQQWEYTFSEAGEYDYWTTAYGVKGKVLVKEKRR